jgi:hypothetical protein
MNLFSCNREEFIYVFNNYSRRWYKGLTRQGKKLLHIVKYIIPSQRISGEEERGGGIYEKPWYVIAAAVTTFLILSVCATGAFAENRAGAFNVTPWVGGYNLDGDLPYDKAGTAGLSLATTSPNGGEPNCPSTMSRPNMTVHLSPAEYRLQRCRCRHISLPARSALSHHEHPPGHGGPVPGGWRRHADDQS